MACIIGYRSKRRGTRDNQQHGDNKWGLEWGLEVMMFFGCCVARGRESVNCQTALNGGAHGLRTIALFRARCEVLWNWWTFTKLNFSLALGMQKWLAPISSTHFSSARLQPVTFWKTGDLPTFFHTVHKSKVFVHQTLLIYIPALNSANVGVNRLKWCAGEIFGNTVMTEGLTEESIVGKLIEWQ